MGIVTDYFINLIKRQVDERGVVVWFDPRQTYSELAKNLALPDSHVAHFEGSYLALRKSVDEWMNDIHSEKPPRLVLYVPLERSDTRHILDEFVFAGAVLQPGEPQPCNTSLDVVARNALRTQFTRERLEEVADGIYKGRITSLDELDRLAAQGDSGALALIYDTGQPSEIAHKFLFDTSQDDLLIQRQATELLASVLNNQFGVTILDHETPAQLRQRVSRQLLTIEFCLRLREQLPASLASIPLPETTHQQTNCLEFVENWRNRRDLQETYLLSAEDTENELSIDYGDFTLEGLRRANTFSGIEGQLQILVEKALRENAQADLIALADVRRKGFWAEADEHIGTRWTLVYTAGEILIMSGSIQRSLRDAPPGDANAYIHQYTDTVEPWSRLDTLHRNFEKFSLAIDYSPGDNHSSLERLLARTRQEYARTVDELSRDFLGSLVRSGFNVSEFNSQNEVFSRYVAPILQDRKVAYVLVDALRYEMAVDLAASLERDWQVEITPVVAVPPTITPVGMAALLPGAERGVSLALVGDLAVQVGGEILKTRRDRVNYLSQKVHGMAEVKLEALIPAKKAVRDALADAKFVLVTSQEIDLLGEGDSIAQGREFMDSVLAKLARGFRVLNDHGVERIIVASDHGYIFADELNADQTIPAPGGQTADLHRRVWVGKGGQAHDGVLRMNTNAFNVGGDLELATPLGLACFASPGGKAYFHGGLSLQELIIPVMVLEPEAAGQPSQIEWILTPGRDKITTRFFSVQVSGRVPSRSMFDAEPPLVRVEVRAAGKTVSSPVTTTYGLQEATGELQMRWGGENSFELEPNTVALMLTGEISQKRVSSFPYSC